MYIIIAVGVRVVLKRQFVKRIVDWLECVDNLSSIS